MSLVTTESQRSRLLHSQAFSLSLILLLALALRLYFFVGYANVDSVDDTFYMQLAGQAREGNLSDKIASIAQQFDAMSTRTRVVYICRPGVYLPIALSQFFWGAGETAAALPSLLASLGIIILTYIIGRRLAGETVALWGALIYALAPLDIIYSTRILPDTPHAFWLTASIAAALEAARADYFRRQRLFLYFSSGLCLYLASLTRQTAIIGIPVLLIVMVPALKVKKTRLEPLIIGLVFVLAYSLQGLYYLHLTGSFWFALRLERAAYRSSFALFPEATFFPFPWLTVHCQYLDGVPHYFFNLFAGTMEHLDGVKLFSSFAPLGVVSTVYALVRRKMGLLIFWFVFVFLAIQYGCQGLEWNGGEGVLHYYLVPSRPRYLLMMLPALCLLLGFLIAETKTRSRTGAIAVFLLLLCPSMYRTNHNHHFYRGSLEDMRRAVQFLSEEQAAPIYSDSWAIQEMNIFSGGELEDLRHLSGSKPPVPVSWVVLGGSRGFDLAGDYIAELLPRQYGGIHLGREREPTNWIRVFEWKGPLNVARPTDLVIFRVE